MKTKDLLLIVILTVVMMMSCRWDTTHDALKSGDVLKSSVEDFEKNRKKLSEKIISSIDQASKKLTDEDPNLPKIAKDWEIEWGKIQKRYKKLHEDFDKVGTNSTEYFNQLDDLSGSINDTQLKTQELEKNKELRKKWDSSYVKASSSITKVDEVLKSGNDFHMVLVASSIRQKLEQNVVELERISEQAKTLLKDLEAFTEAGRALVEG